MSEQAKYVKAAFISKQKHDKFVVVHGHHSVDFEVIGHPTLFEENSKEMHKDL